MWDECNLYCVGLGANLVKIETTQENNYIYSLTTSNTPYWAGGRDVVTGNNCDQKCSWIKFNDNHGTKAITINFYIL